MSTETIALNVLTDAILQDVRARAIDVARDAFVKAAGGLDERLKEEARKLVGHDADLAITNEFCDFAASLATALAERIERREVARITRALTGQEA